MLILIASHVIATMTPPISVQLPLGVSLAVGAALVPTGFWLFARGWFNDRLIVGWTGWLGAMAALGIAAVQVFLAQLGGGSPYMLQVAVRVMMIAFALAGLWEAWRGRRDDLVEVRRRLRLGLVWAVGLFALATNAVEIATDQDILPAISALMIEVGILALCMIFAFILLDLKSSQLFAAQNLTSPKPVPALFDGERAQQLLDHMKASMAWRDETYSIAKLADDLGEQEYRLRRLINGQLGFRNFSAFLASFRLDEVRAALRDPSQKDVPISTIALDAGFGSLGPFNRLFREAEGLTPSEFRTSNAG